MLGLLKRAGESLLVKGGPAAVGRRVFCNRSLILAYHNILPDEAPLGGNKSLHLPRSTFASQLDQLTRRCDVMQAAPRGC